MEKPLFLSIEEFEKVNEETLVILLDNGIKDADSKILIDIIKLMLKINPSDRITSEDGKKRLKEYFGKPDFCNHH